MIGVDTNVLVYAHRMDLLQHAAARAALQRQASGPDTIAIPAFVFAEFVRVVTHPRTFEMPSSLTAATSFLDELDAHASVRTVAPGPGYWPVLRDMLARGDASGNDAYAAHVVATLRSAGIDQVLSNDHTLGRFGAIEVVTLDG